MKIGVFGDSFCDRSWINDPVPKIWYNFLQKTHELECFGEGGSSIWFSANLILQKADQFDLVIWCVTNTGRFTLPYVINDRHVHVTNIQSKFAHHNVEIATKHRVCVDYLKYIFDWSTENFVWSAVVEKVCKLHHNIMIIPCFSDPLNSKFNLYSVCSREAQHYFPNMEILEIYSTHQDLRAGHLTPENQKILAELISQDLQPGIFQTNYENFVTPTQPFEKVFSLL